jgi:hypothetical protein
MRLPELQQWLDEQTASGCKTHIIVLDQGREHKALSQAPRSACGMDSDVHHRVRVPGQDGHAGRHPGFRSQLAEEPHRSA